MTLDQLLTELELNQVVLSVDGDRMRYRAPVGALSDDTLTAIAQHRTALVDYFRAKVQPCLQRPEKCITCEQQYWVDEPPKYGRIRTTCSKCGQFIGYRPVAP